MKRLLLAAILPVTLACAAQNPAVEAINHFGLAALRHSQGNALLSPWSLQQSLALVYAGAQGQTQTEMALALGYEGDPAALHAAFKELAQALALPIEGANPIRSANRLFAAERVRFKPGWLELAKSNYAAEPILLAFSDPAKAGKTINQWVNEQTAGKIPDVIPAGGLTGDISLVLVNALYFGMPWEERFTKELTTDKPFYIARGQSKTVPLMFKQHRQRYAHKDGYQIAALPFAGETMQLVVLLPDNGNGFEEMEQSLTPQILAACATLPKAEVRLSILRLKLQPPIVSMNKVLSDLGMKTAFSNAADFSGMMEGGAHEKLAAVFHRAFLDMDEDGAKAASATATVIHPKNGAPHEIPHETVRADHPFIFLIQHVPSGACLFIGRVADPAPDVSAKVQSKINKK